MQGLLSNIIPTKKTEFDTRWDGLYAPLRSSGRFEAVPVSVTEYKSELFIHFFSINTLAIGREKHPDFADTADKEQIKIFRKILIDMEKLMKIFRKAPSFLEKIVPYNYRTGKIPGKYVLEKLISQEEKARLSSQYRLHLQKNLKAPPQSLEDYLRVAGLCYRMAYGDKTKGLSDLEMYRKWADTRHGGMLEIKDTKSPGEYEAWHRSGKWVGCHPFEIVFSWHRHGIHLYPPGETERVYSISVTNYAYAGDFALMSEALMKNGIPFKAHKFEEVLSYLSGDTFFGVNDQSDHSICYYPSAEDRKLYFRHVEWDALKLPELKQPENRLSKG